MSLIHTHAYERWMPLIARLLLAIQFSVGAYFKIVFFPMEVAQTASVGVPFATIAVGLAFILEALGIIALVTGWQIRLFAALLAPYVALLAVLFYHHWSDPMNFGSFMSHLGLIAALLYVSVYGARSFSLRNE